MKPRIFVCHDYAPNGREFLGDNGRAQRANNIHVGNNAAEDSFVEMREKRDASLTMPRLIMPSIQVNMRAGHMPDAEENGATYLKVPVRGSEDSQGYCVSQALFTKIFKL